MIERFFENLIDRVHSKLGFWRSGYMIIGLLIIIFGFKIVHNMIPVTSPYWIWTVLIIAAVGAFFIAVARFAKDKPKNEDDGKNK